MTRRILIVTNPSRDDTAEASDVAREALTERGVLAIDAVDGGPIEAVIVLGGDGTILRAVRETFGSGAPVLGVNMGHVGFLAELERDRVRHAAQRLADGDFTVEERHTVAVTVRGPGGEVAEGWALNDAALEREELLRMLDLALEVDGRPLTSFGCDGVVVATPTGSTAHAFSAGGPVIWPDVEALLMVPLAAHALFAKPLVVGRGSTIAVEVLERSYTDGVVVLDGATTIPAPRGSRVELRLGDERVRLARLSDAPFVDRLVRKFALPTDGWRGATED